MLPTRNSVGISYIDHVTNGEFCAKIQQAIEPQRPLDHRKETQIDVVWTCLLFICLVKNHLARHSERGKKTRQTGEEVGRQHPGTGVPQVLGDSGEQRNGGNCL